MRLIMSFVQFLCCDRHLKYAEGSFKEKHVPLKPKHVSGHPVVFIGHENDVAVWQCRNIWLWFLSQHHLEKCPLWAELLSVSTCRRPRRLLFFCSPAGPSDPVVPADPEENTLTSVSQVRPLLKSPALGKKSRQSQVNNPSDKSDSSEELSDWTDLQHHAYVGLNLRWVFGELLCEAEKRTASMLGLHDPNC